MLRHLVADWQPHSYLEPFLGGGAVLLAAGPWETAIASDTNEDLVRTFAAVQSSADQVSEFLDSLADSKALYDQLRRHFPRISDEYERAASFIFLNRCAYGGIHRTNRAGEFNVPYGGARGLHSVTRPGALSAVAAALKNVELVACSFQETLQRATDSSLVYCDPVYATPGEGVFDRYQSGGFRWHDQVRLAAAAHDVAAAGSLVVVSNGHHPDIRALYAGTAEELTLRRRTQLPKSTAKQVYESVFILGEQARDAAAVAHEAAARCGLV